MFKTSNNIPVTANNGLTKSGNNLRLGGELTGTTEVIGLDLNNLIFSSIPEINVFGTSLLRLQNDPQSSTGQLKFYVDTNSLPERQTIDFDDTSSFGGRAQIYYETTGSADGSLTISNTVFGETGHININAGSQLNLRGGQGNFFSGISLDAPGVTNIVNSFQLDSLAAPFGETYQLIIDDTGLVSSQAIISGSSSYTFQNGITESGGTVNLGGSLDNTSVEFLGNGTGDFLFDALGAFEVRATTASGGTGIISFQTDTQFRIEDEITQQNMFDLQRDSFALINMEHDGGIVSNSNGLALLVGSSNPAVGDIHYVNAVGGYLERLPIGSTGQVLTVNSGLPSWQTPASGFTDPMTTRGDIIVRDATNTTDRLPIGSGGTFLSSDGLDLSYRTLTLDDLPNEQFLLQTGTSYTLQSTDVKRVIRFTNNSPITVILPNGLSTGFATLLVKAGTGNITISAATTLEGGSTISGDAPAYGVVTHRGSNIWMSNVGSGSISGNSSGYTNLTQFDNQTPWRLFYSDGNGDVTELPLGSGNTFLKSSGVSAVPTWESITQNATHTGEVTGSTLLTLRPSSISNRSIITSVDTINDYLLIFDATDSSLKRVAPINLGLSGFTNLTEFDNQTPWRLFYSDGNGDVTELPLGSGNTFLKSNGISAVPTWESISGDSNYLITNTITGTTYTLLSTDNGKVLRFTNSSNITVSVPNGLDLGFNLLILKAGTGNIVLNVTGTLEGQDTLSGTAPQFGTLYSRDTNTWVSSFGSSGVSGFTNLTQFDNQTAWRLFYSDGNGDVTELPLGSGNTYLKSNGISAVPTWETPSGSSYTFGNGLTETGGTVSLGGVLSNDVTLNTDGVNDFIITDGEATFGIKVSDGGGYISLDGNFVVRDSATTDEIFRITSDNILTPNLLNDDSITRVVVVDETTGQWFYRNVNSLGVSGNTGGDLIIWKEITGTTYTIINDDNTKSLYVTNTGNTTITIPTGLITGLNCIIYKEFGSGNVLVVSNGTLIGLNDELTVDDSSFTLLHRGNNEHVLFGGDIGSVSGGTGFADPMTTRGDIIYRNSSNITERLGRGLNGTFLSSDGLDISYRTLNVNDLPNQQFLLQTGTSYTLQESDNKRIIRFTNNSAISVTLPNGLSTGFTSYLVKAGVGNVTISAATTLEGGSTISGDAPAYGFVTHRGSNIWMSNVGSSVSGGTGSGYTNLIQFVSQTPWRLFYSDGNGDVTELPLGSGNTYLKSNGVSAVPTWDIPTGGISDGNKTDITVSGSGSSWIINNQSVTYSKIQNVAANSFLANLTGSPASLTEVATNRIPLFGSAITGTPSASTFLRGDGSWQTVSGSGLTYAQVKALKYK